MSKQVTVAKDYVHCNNPDDVLTFEGSIAVEAESQAEAELLVNGWMAGKGCERPLQTIDPRIKWDECCDPEALDDEGYNYLDWSFRVQS
jgi:hypothetical protein